MSSDNDSYIQSVIESDEFKSRLRYMLKRWFSSAQLSELCENYFIDVYMRFNARTHKAHKIKLLVNYCYRHGRVGDLLRAIYRMKPAAYHKIMIPFTATGLPLPVSASESTTEAQGQPTFSTLLNTLDRQFNEEELRTLCFDLGVDYDNLGGSTKQSKARELILYMNRRGQLARLISAIQAARPGQ